MSKHRGSDDDDDSDGPSPLLQTTRFSKPNTFGSKDFSSTLTRPKPGASSNLHINLGTIGGNDGDSLDDSDDETTGKTARSTSSGASSQPTPKPRERSFLKKDGEKPKTSQPLFPLDDDDERNVFGQGGRKASSPQRFTTLKEDEENDQKFSKGFSNNKKRHSPEDLFATDRTVDSRRGSRKFADDRDDGIHHDSDEEPVSARQAKQTSFIKSGHSSTANDKSGSRKNSTRSKDGTDKSDNDDVDNDHSHRQSDRQDFRSQRPSTYELEQTTPKDPETTATQHQAPSSRPGSASRKEPEPARRSSFCEDQNTVIPPATQQQPQSRPTSAKSTTSRQQTQSAIDGITSANMPPTLDPLTSNNEALAAALHPSLPPPPPPRPSARLPPRPKSNLNSSTSGDIHKKSKVKVPSRYKEITSRIDNGRNPAAAATDLTASVQRALEKELKSKTIPRPQSARSRTRSANDNSTTARQRRLSASAYDHVKPRVNTNLSINFDELNTSQMRAESSQSIKDGVYMEWLKTKEDERKQNKEMTKRWEEEKAKHVDKAQVERRLQQSLQHLQQWRQMKEEEAKRKKQEELKLQREKEEDTKRAQEQKRKNARDGFDNWEQKKKEETAEKKDEEQNKKAEIEKRQEEKRKKELEAEKAYQRWNEKKAKQSKKTQESQKANREEHLKKLHENEETKFVSAQDAYEKWLQEKEKREEDDKVHTQRRNSLSRKQQQQVPFLPGGSQKNTGKVQHVVW